MIEVKRLSELDENEISLLEDGLSSTPMAGPYHNFGWLRGCSQGYGHTVYLVLERPRGKAPPSGLLPLVHLRVPFLLNTLVSLPFCDYGGPVFHESSGPEEMLRASHSLSRDLGAGLEIRCSKALQGGTDELGLVPSTEKVRLLLELSAKTPEELLKSFKSKLRSQIRRPQKEGCQGVVGGMELFGEFYPIFARKMHELGSPVHSKWFFESMFKGANDNWFRIVLVKKDSQVISGAVLLFSGKCATVPWAASLSEYNRLSPNMLLYWTMLSLAVERRCQWFDFGRSTPGSGTYRFKKQWGAEPVPLYWYKKNGKADHGVGHSNSKRAPDLRQVAEDVWAHLPMWLTNQLGPRIRRFISL